MVGAVVILASEVPAVVAMAMVHGPSMGMGVIERQFGGKKIGTKMAGRVIQNTKSAAMNATSNSNSMNMKNEKLTLVHRRPKTHKHREQPS